MAQSLSIYSLITPLQILCPWMLRATSKSLLPQISLTCLMSHLHHLIFPNLRPLFSSPFGISNSTPIWPLSPRNPTPPSSSLTAWLATEPKKMPLCFNSGRWSLQPATITAWKSLERNLVTATMGLFAFATKQYPGHDRRSILIDLKFHYSYDRASVDKEELLSPIALTTVPCYLAYFSISASSRTSKTGQTGTCILALVSSGPRGRIVSLFLS